MVPLLCVRENFSLKGLQFYCENLIKNFFPSKDFLTKESAVVRHSLALSICWPVTNKEAS